MPFEARSFSALARRKSGVGRRRLCVFAIALAGLLSGCGGQPRKRAPKPDAPIAAPSAATATKIETKAGDNGDLPPELVKKVEELIKRTKELNAFAAGIQNSAAFKEKRDDYSRLDAELSSLVEDFMIAEAKLNPKQKERLDREYYDTRVKPEVDQSRQHRSRLRSL